MTRFQWLRQIFRPSSLASSWRFHSSGTPSAQLGCHKLHPSKPSAMRVCMCVCDSLHLCHLHADDVIFYRIASFRHRNVRMLDKVIWSRITTIALIQATKRNSLKFDCLPLILFSLLSTRATHLPLPRTTRRLPPQTVYQSLCLSVYQSVPLLLRAHQPGTLHSDAIGISKCQMATGRAKRKRREPRVGKETATKILIWRFKPISDYRQTHFITFSLDFGYWFAWQDQITV